MPALQLIAHDIRSRENVGALFRICDSLGVSKLWLTGYTAGPPDAKIAKVALGAERSVAFERIVDVISVIQRLKQNGSTLYALELTSAAIELSAFRPPMNVALLLGSERHGVPPSLLELCAGAIKINQQGVKESLNVAVAAGIAAWVILHA